MLGFLNEHFGRTVAQDSELIEHFFVNEQEKAQVFEENLQRVIQEYQLDTTVRREMAGDGDEKHTYFFSRELTQLIDSYYLNHYLTGREADGSPAYTKGGGFFRESPGMVSDAIFPAGDREARLSYLIGAYQRYGERNYFRFYNAAHKVKLVAKLLKEAGSPNVVIVYPDPEAIPAVFLVAFEPTDELIDRFNLGMRDYYNYFAQEP